VYNISVVHKNTEHHGCVLAARDEWPLRPSARSSICSARTVVVILVHLRLDSRPLALRGLRSRTLLNNLSSLNTVLLLLFCLPWII